MFGMFSCRKFRPINKSPNPIINSPQLLRIRFAEKSKGRLNPIKGRERLTMLILNPRMEMSHAVNVVPTLAPMMTPIEPIRSSKPALTKLKSHLSRDWMSLRRGWFSFCYPLPFARPHSSSSYRRGTHPMIRSTARNRESCNS